jgi:hypothetical protein
MTPHAAGVLAAPETRPKPRLRVASFDDYEQIAVVTIANGLSAKSREQWLRLWLGNPAYEQLPNWPIGWVLEDTSGRIVGSLENVPCLYRLEGRTYVGAFGRGWAVDEPYRVCALRLLSTQMRQPGVDLLLTSTASPRTTALLTRRGWSQVPAGQWDRSAFWLPALSRWPRSAPGRYDLHWCSRFDERFDQFSTELEARNPARLLGMRTHEALQWHFQCALEQGRTSILTAAQGGRLIAYAVFERRPIRSWGSARFLVIDFQTLAADRDLVTAMFSAALERCRRERVLILENIGCWLEAKQPIVHKPRFRRSLGNWGYLYYATNPELAIRLHNAESWYPTQYDADASL